MALKATETFPGRQYLAITEMETMTQQNAAMVEQASAAAGALQELAEKLDHAVNVFKADSTADTQLPVQEADIASAQPDPSRDDRLLPPLLRVSDGHSF